MSGLDVVQQDWWEGEDPGVTLFRAVGANRVPLVTAEVSSISIAILDMSTKPKVTLATLTPTLGQPEAMWFDTLQKNDGYWQRDGIGYNFRHYTKLSDAVFVGGHLYRWEFWVITPVFPTKWGTLVGVREGTYKETFR